MSESSFSDSPPARIPLPVRPRKRSCSPTRGSSPSKRLCNSNRKLLRSYNVVPRIVQHSTCGWTALKFEAPACEEDDGIEFEPEEEDNQSIPDSNSYDSATSPSTPRFRDRSVPRSSPTISPVASPRSETAHPRIADDIWNIDGFDVRSFTQKSSKTRFTPKQEAKILLWMKVNEARGITGNPTSFQKLLADLRFTGKGHPKEVETALRVKVGAKINNFYASLKKKGIVEDVEVDTKSRQESFKIKFAAYTETWLRPNWDGSTEFPYSWLAETVEVDHEIDEHDNPDNAPDNVIAESPPRQKQQKESTLVVQRPVFNILADVKNYWTEEIRSKKSEADRKAEKNVWDQEAIHEADWNFAAVQAQYAGVDMSKKVIVEEAFDRLLDDLLNSSDSSQFDRPSWSSPRTPLSGIIRHRPGDSYAGVESTDEWSITEPQMQMQVPIRDHHRLKFCQSIVSLEAEDEGGLGGRGSESVRDYDGQDHANTATDEYEDESIEEDFADEEDNVDEEENVDEDDDTEMIDAGLPIPLTGTTSTFPSTDLEPLISPREAIAAQQAAKQFTEYSLAATGGVPYEIIPLTCATYQRWKSQLHAILLIHDTWGVISGDLQPPVPYSTSDGEDFQKEWDKYQLEAEEWRKKMGHSLGWMKLTMGAETRDLVAHFKDPIELWALLKDEFEVQD